MFALLRFNMNHCDLHKSWILKENTLFEVDRYVDSQDQCSDEFASFYQWEKSSSHFNYVGLEVTNLNSCSGNYQLDFDGTSDDFGDNFHDAKLLCNNNDIVSFLAIDPSSEADYQVWFMTDSNRWHAPFDSYFYDTPYLNGEYCEGMFDLMNDIFTGFRNDGDFFNALPSACGASYTGYSPDEGGLSTGAKVGISVGVLIVLANLVIIAVYCNRKKSRERDEATATAAAGNKNAQVTAHGKEERDLEGGVDTIPTKVEEKSEEDETIRISINPDGTRIITRTITHQASEGLEHDQIKSHSINPVQDVEEEEEIAI